jgi:hypothetical protein
MKKSKPKSPKEKILIYEPASSGNADFVLPDCERLIQGALISRGFNRNNKYATQPPAAGTPQYVTMAGEAPPMEDFATIQIFEAQKNTARAIDLNNEALIAQQKQIESLNAKLAGIFQEVKSAKPVSGHTPQKLSDRERNKRMILGACM